MANGAPTVSNGLVISGVTTSTTFSGSGASLTNLNGSNIASGTVPIARIGTGTKNTSTFYRGDGTFATVTSTTINNNANNRLITGSGTANTLEGEANIRFDGATLTVDGTTTDTPLILTSTNVSGSHMRFQKDGSNKHFVGSGGGFGLGDVDDLSLRTVDNIIFGVGTSEKVRITSSGNVGINDTDPSYALNVIGDNTASNGIGMLKGIIGVQNNTTAYGSYPTAGISFQTKYRTGPDVPLDVAAIWGGKENTTNGDKDGYMGFATREEGGSGSQERMRITSDGKVVAGGNGAGYPCRLQSHGAGDLLDLNSTSGAGKIRFYESGAGRFNIETLNGTAGLRFYDSLNGVERMRISGEGIISMPNQPMVRTRGGWSNVDWNGYKQISWNGEDEDIGSNFSSGVFTVPSGGAGRYIVTAQFIGPSNAGQFVLWSFFKNTTALNPWVQIYSGSTNTETGAGTVATTCAVGDTLRIAWHGSYSTPYNGGYNSFSIYKVH